MSYRINLEKIEELRLKKDISQEEMAKTLGYQSASSYNKAAKGKANFKAEHIPVIADKLGVSMDALYLCG